ncbi:MAG: arginine-ornithine antiporter, partial [Candidatus Binatia bacterium]
YAAAMIYAGGLTFLLLSAILYAPGSALYFLARREQKGTVLTATEQVIFGLVVVAALGGIYGLVSGHIAV